MLAESDVIAVDDDLDHERNDDTYAIPGCSYWYDIPISECNETEAQPDGSAPLTSLEPDCTAPPPPSQPPSTAPAAASTAAAAAVASSAPVPAAAAPPLTTTTDSSVQPLPAPVVENPTPELDADLLEILGEDPTSTKEYGPDIQKDLAIRLSHITTSGLSKEIRKELKEKYLVPTNCKAIKAPVLNPEIRAALIDTQAKRDKGIENKQVLTSCALSSLSAAITLLLSSGNKNPELLKLLMDTARILGDIQHADSILRRFFILSTVKKDLKDQLEKTKIDETLFGNNLAETLKSAKTINKSGADLRSASTAKLPPQKATKTPSRPLNYRAPPANRRPPAPGGARTTRAAHSAPTPRQTTTTPAQHSGSRTSSRQPNTRYRR